MHPCPTAFSALEKLLAEYLRTFTYLLGFNPPLRAAAGSASNPEQTMSSRLLTAAGILLLINGCATVQKESPEAYAARLQASCTEAGFQRDTESYRLCLLIQDTNERLDAVEQQVRYVDMNTSFRPYHHWW
jgi:hypothetical protein